MNSRAHQAKLLRKIPIRVDLCPLYTFQIFALNKRFNALLDHVNLGFELSDKLAECL